MLSICKVMHVSEISLFDISKKKKLRKEQVVKARRYSCSSGSSESLDF